MKTRFSPLLAGLFATAISAQFASAAVVTLSNSGFENDSVAPNSGTPLVPTGWTKFAGSGGGDAFVGDGGWVTIPGAHSGDQFYLAYSAGSHQTIRQETSLMWSSLTAGDQLTISAWTTYRSDLPAAPTHFWLNDSDASGLFSAAFNVTDTSAGIWTERVWTYTVTQETLDAAALNNWGAVEVQVGILGAGGNRQVAFDDISLTLTPVPEPSGMVLAVTALGLALLRRKR